MTVTKVTTLSQTLGLTNVLPEAVGWFVEVNAIRTSVGDLCVSENYNGGKCNLLTLHATCMFPLSLIYFLFSV